MSNTVYVSCPSTWRSWRGEKEFNVSANNVKDLYHLTSVVIRILLSKIFIEYVLHTRVHSRLLKYGHESNFLSFRKSTIWLGRTVTQ